MLVVRKMFPHFRYIRYKMLNTHSSNAEIPALTASRTSENCSQSLLAENGSSKDEGEEFRQLLRHSTFINMGDPEDKIVRGRIYHVVGDDLYVDSGWKFHCVCSKPVKGGELYVRGAEVILKMKNLELSTKFLGAEKGLTLLEADASIIKLLSTPAKQNSDT